jgi:hypothetical protein
MNGRRSIAVALIFLLAVWIFIMAALILHSG